MKKLLQISALSATAALLAACGSTATNVNVNANHNSNTANGNGSGSMVGNAVNSVANAASSVMTPSPESFMTDAAQGGMAEVALGKLAGQKAKDPAVKAFGQMMVADHTKANEELKAIAAKKNFQLPADVGSHKSDMDDLSKLSGADFDKEYVEMMVDDHEEDVKNFQRMADNGSDPDLKAFAAKTLPTLQKHLEAIKALQAKMNNGGSAANANGASATGNANTTKKP
jgi:putative membrane protein